VVGRGPGLGQDLGEVVGPPVLQLGLQARGPAPGLQPAAGAEGAVLVMCGIAGSMGGDAAGRGGRKAGGMVGSAPCR